MPLTIFQRTLNTVFSGSTSKCAIPETGWQKRKPQSRLIIHRLHFLFYVLQPKNSDEWPPGLHPLMAGSVKEETPGPTTKSFDALERLLVLIGPVYCCPNLYLFGLLSRIIYWMFCLTLAGTEQRVSAPPPFLLPSPLPSHSRLRALLFRVSSTNL